MLYGFKIVEDMIDGLSDFMDAKGYQSIEDFRGMATPNVVDWNDLDMNYDVKARINADSCIECGKCHIVCEDTSHQAIAMNVDADSGKRSFAVIDDECVGCNLCQIVCPVPECITMEKVENGLPYLNWPNHPSNIAKEAAE